MAVHGNGGGAFRFARVAPLLDRAGTFRPVTLPGFADIPLDPSLRTVQDYADRLGDLLSEAGPAPVLLGHGIGGSFALDLASRRPRLVGGLILHAPVAVDLDRRLLPRALGTAPARWLAQRLIASRPLRPLLRRRFFPTGAPRPYLDQFFDAYRTCPAFGQMFEIINADWFDRLAPVRDVPTVLLWGENDQILGADQIASLQAKIPAAEVVIQPEWDHFPMIEQPESYAREILAIARRLAASAG